MAADFNALSNAIDTAAQHANDAKARAARVDQKVTTLQGQVDELRQEITNLGGGVDTQPLIDKLNAVDGTVDSIAEEASTDGSTTPSTGDASTPSTTGTGDTQNPTA